MPGFDSLNGEPSGFSFGSGRLRVAESPWTSPGHRSVMVGEATGKVVMVVSSRTLLRITKLSVNHFDLWNRVSSTCCTPRQPRAMYERIVTLPNEAAVQRSAMSDDKTATEYLGIVLFLLGLLQYAYSAYE